MYRLMEIQRSNNHHLSSWHADDQALIRKMAERLVNDAADHIITMVSERAIGSENGS